MFSTFLFVILCVVIRLFDLVCSGYFGTNACDDLVTNLQRVESKLKILFARSSAQKDETLIAQQYVRVQVA